MRKTFVDTLVNYAKSNNNVMLLTGDLGAGALEPFQKAFGQRYINCGIAEQNMIAVATGLAMMGKEIVIYSIGNFDTLRVIEFVRNLVCYNEANIKIVSVGAGLEYGSLGFTHHSTEDIACMRSLPNMKVFNPSTASECQTATLKMLEDDGPCYLRLAKKGLPESVEVPVVNLKSKKCLSVPVSFKSTLSGFNKIFDGTKALVIGSGTIVSQAIIAKFQAEQLLNTQNVVAVYSLAQLKPINNPELVNVLKKYKYIYTIEEHTVMGGLGSIIAEQIAQNGLGAKLKMIGINDEVSKVVGTRDYLISGNAGGYNINATPIVQDLLTNLIKK